MEYAFITILQLLGIGFNIGEKLVKLGDQFPDKTPREIIHFLIRKNWIPLFISALVLTLDLVAHLIINYYKVPIRSNEYYFPGSFALALVLGYAGQRLAYRYLGKAEEFINKKADEKLQ